MHTCTDSGCEAVQWFCCTWEGLDRLKRFVALCTGAGVLTASILTLLNPADSAFKPVSFVRSCWNAIFGLLMILVQFRGSRWSSTRASPPSRPTSWIKRRFGFMSGWFGRALFFFFVGTNIVEPDSPSTLTVMLTIVIGVACLCVGALELLFGFRCAERSDGSEGSSGSGKAGASEPSPSANAPAKQSSFARVFGGTVCSSLAPPPPHPTTSHLTPPHPSTSYHGPWATPLATLRRLAAHSRPPRPQRGVQEPHSTPARDQTSQSPGAPGPSWAAPPVVMGEPAYVSASQALEGAAPPANSSAETNPFYCNSHLPGP